MRETIGFRGGSRRVRWPRHAWRAWAAGASLMLALPGCERKESVPPDAAAAATGPVEVGAEIGSFYRDRGFKPLWIAGRKVKPEAERLIREVERAALHGLDPAGYEPERLRRAVKAAENRDPNAVAQAELLISRAYTQLIRDLHRPPARTAILYVDEALKPAPVPAALILERLAAAPDFAAQVEADLGVNPLYRRMADGFARYFRQWSGLPQIAVPADADLRPGMEGAAIATLRRRLGLKATPSRYDQALSTLVRRFEEVHGLPPDGVADRIVLAALNRGYRHYERIIQLNLERARAVEVSSGSRFILVDSAGARLWLFEGDRPVDSMRVVVGKPGMETPEMAAQMRFVVLNPYWNVPPDLIRDKVARQVLTRGVGYIRSERLQVLSDWSAGARVLDPARVNWRAVASGNLVQVRQLPGPGNMMGRMKFMFPNKLGIYLHDTPAKALFALDDRRVSSGCVRLEDAQRLARRLFSGRVPAPSGAAEERVDLPDPVPVHIAYLTALPGPGGIRFQPDRYGRDAKLLS